MLKYLIIPLAQDSVSFCHYARNDGDETLIPLHTLRNSIRWAMKENLNIQFVYPDRELPSEYKETIDTIDHTDIVGSGCKDKVLLGNADVVVIDSLENICEIPWMRDCSYVVRATKENFIKNKSFLVDALSNADRIVAVLIDMVSFKKTDFDEYKNFLEEMSLVVKSEYKKGHAVHFNLLTDRIFLENYAKIC